MYKAGGEYATNLQLFRNKGNGQPRIPVVLHGPDGRDHFGRTQRECEFGMMAKLGITFVVLSIEQYEMCTNSAITPALKVEDLMVNGMVWKLKKTAWYDAGRYLTAIGHHWGGTR
eukprot:CAMPEP_0185902846 /NCGR_PEP_ID=MMETSP0196C-20130402/2058_1 /TAXON_ID=2932 /ORGANISM="Alexandrium fundyense, Strain CCMP1719" /LENGTH=114 /DNA_ID=CAMNT_0028621767 /DNA_START=131 /DNA_END=471 /DNA_ORIENTATION=+